MKRVRLTPTETRDWLQNRSYYVVDGVVQREATSKDPPNQRIPYRRLISDSYLEKHGSPIQLVRTDGCFLRVLRKEGTAEVARRTPVLIPDPEHCQCANYAGRLEDQHHAVCEYRSAWERLKAGKPMLTIIDIATGKALRIASPEEAEQFETSRSPIIKIGGTDYGIVES